MITTERSLGRLMDLEGGTISREVFVNEDIYRQEQEQIFARGWLFLGHESQIPKAGDFFVSSMGEESVILVRDRQRNIHAFLNTCRHRGMKVCRYDQGNTVMLTCPFHGWTYDIDGRLAAVPGLEEAYFGRLDKAQWGLIEVPQLAIYKGSIWATWDKDAPPFEDYLGDFRFYLDTLFDASDGGDGGVEVLDGVHKWHMPCNWKFPASSFGADAAHAVSHRSTQVAGYGPQQQQGDRHGVRRTDTQRLEVTVPSLGHGAHISAAPGTAPYVPTWGSLGPVDEYFRIAHQRRLERRKEPLQVEVGAATVFPNTSFAAGIRRTIVVWNPRGPQMTEAWRFYMVDRDAPEEVRDAVRRFLMRYAGPVGMTEQDDAENWNYASAASKGAIARRYPYNYQLGFDQEALDLPIPGVVTPVLSEHGQRIRFDRWLEFMEAASWDDIYPKRPGRRNGR